MRELEDAPDLPATISHAQRLIAKLQTLSEEYKVYHFAVIDFIDDEEELATQQSKLDNLDDDVAQITARLEELAARWPPGVDKVDKVANVTLRYLERTFTGVSENLSSLDTRDNTCLLQQHQEHLQDLKKELSDEYMSAEHEDTGGMLDMLKGVHFTLSLQVQIGRLSYASTTHRYSGFETGETTNVRDPHVWW